MHVQCFVALLLGCYISNEMLSECFQVHHGGAGTTSAGLKAAVIFISYLLSIFCWALPYIFSPTLSTLSQY